MKTIPFLRASGFSLVETSLALGIVSVALVAILALVPSGMEHFRHSLSDSVQTQIVERLITEIQQTDFDLLPDKAGLRHFDEQGTERDIADNAAFRRDVYTAQLVVTMGTDLPGNIHSKNLATVNIRLAENPGHHPDPFNPTSPLSMRSSITHVARNR